MVNRIFKNAGDRTVVFGRNQQQPMGASDFIFQALDRLCLMLIVNHDRESIRTVHVPQVCVVPSGDLLEGELPRPGALVHGQRTLSVCVTKKSSVAPAGFAPSDSVTDTLDPAPVVISAPS